MATVKRLHKTLKELEKLLSQCVKCGLCQSVCPLYLETRKEIDVARGKIALVEGLTKKVLKNPEGVVKRLKRCLLCGSCMAICPSEVKSLEIFLKARAMLSDFERLSTVKKLLIRILFTSRKRFNLVAEILKKLQKVLLLEASKVFDTYHLKLDISPLKKRHLKGLAWKPFTPKPFFIFSQKTTKVAFFTGCLIERIFPEIGTSTVEILQRLNFNIFIPEEQLCCGFPSLSLGDIEAFKRQVYHNVKVFNLEDFQILLTSCSTCTYTIKKLWPLMFPEQPEIANLASRTMDIVEFLAKEIPTIHPLKTPSPKPILTYHDSCHLRKSLKIWKEPRLILTKATNYCYVEMEDADACCGFGGTFSIEFQEISEKIGMKKLEHIKNSGAQIVATSCPACMIQLIDIISRNKLEIHVKHVVEIYKKSFF